MIYLVRHEETPLNVDNRFRGSADPSLTARGAQQAGAIRDRLAGKFDRIVTDGYTRTQQTARIIADGHPVETDQGLSCWDIGDFSGKPKDGIEAKFDKAYVDHPQAVPPNGESLRYFLDRWEPVFERYKQQSEDENIVLVTHGSNIGAVLSGFKPAPIQGSITQHPGAIVLIKGYNVPKFLEAKLKKQYGAKSKVPFKIMNSIGAMKGSKETAKGRMMQQKHSMKLSQLKRAK